MEEIDLLTRFKNYGMTVQEYLDFYRNFIVRLRDFDERFKTVYSVGFTEKSCRYIKEDLSDFDEVVLSQLSRRVAYINPDPANKKPTLQSRCKSNFMHSVANTHRDDDCVLVRITCGRIEREEIGLGAVNIEYSKDLQETLTLDELLARLEFMVGVLPLAYAMIGHTLIMDEINDGLNENLDEIKIGWITYTNRIETAEVLPDYVSYKKLPTGVIFWLSDTKIAADNMEYVEKAIEVRNILAKHDLLKYRV